MKRLAALALSLVLGLAPAGQAGTGTGTALAEAYEGLANTIIAVRETESALVRAILTAHHDAARAQLDAARAAAPDARAKHLQDAATEITYLAGEGDKRVQAVLQRLLKAGHHHHTDGYTSEDYMYVDSAEKKALLDLAGKVAKIDDPTAIPAVAKELDGLVASTLTPE
jgi:hypothetical protein